MSGRTFTAEQIASYKADHAWREAHYAWRKRLSAHMPAIAGRVFALRTTGYRGSGFHWGMEGQLGKLLAWINNYDTALSPETPAVERMALEFLLRDLIRAEFSARGWDFPEKPHPVFGARRR